MVITYDMFKRGEYKVFNRNGEEIDGILELNLKTMKADIVSMLSVLSTDVVFPDGSSTPIDATVDSEPMVLRSVDMRGCRIVKVTNERQNK